MLGQIWIKIYAKEKIKHNLSVYSLKSDIEKALITALKELDISQPILNMRHKKEWEEFSITRFTPNDFIDSVNFDIMEVSYIAPKAKNKVFY